MDVLFEQHRECVAEESTSKEAHIYSGVDLRYVGVASNGFKHLSTFCGRETAKLCSFDSAGKFCWTRCGENFFSLGEVVPFESRVTPFLNAVNAGSTEIYWPTFSSAAAVLTCR